MGNIYIFARICSFWCPAIYTKVSFGVLLRFSGIPHHRYIPFYLFLKTAYILTHKERRIRADFIQNIISLV